jgi:hypothetical protein
MSHRYLLRPGRVTSATDGGQNYVGASELAALYGVRRDECLVLADGSGFEYSRFRQQVLARVERGELIELRPRYDGNYALPTAHKES